MLSLFFLIVLLLETILYNSNRKEYVSRIKTAKNTYQRQINLQSQFKLLLEIITRTKNFFEGQKRFSEFLRSPPQELSGSKSEAKSSEKFRR